MMNTTDPLTSDPADWLPRQECVDVANTYRRRWLEERINYDTLAAKHQTIVNDQPVNQWYQHALILLGGVGIGIIAHEITN